MRFYLIAHSKARPILFYFNIIQPEQVFYKILLLAEQ